MSPDPLVERAKASAQAAKRQHGYVNLCRDVEALAAALQESQVREKQLRKELAGANDYITEAGARKNEQLQQFKDRAEAAEEREKGLRELLSRVSEAADLVNVGDPPPLARSLLAEIHAALASQDSGEKPNFAELPCSRCGATPETGQSEGCFECEGILSPHPDSGEKPE